MFAVIIKEKVKEIAEEYSRRIWNERDYQAINELLDKDVVVRGVFGDIQGWEKVADLLKAWHKGFPDLVINHTGSFSENDTVIIQWEFNATHLGEFKSWPATGKKVSNRGMTVYRVLNGKIIQYRTYIDLENFLFQIK